MKLLQICIGIFVLLSIFWMGSVYIEISSITISIPITTIPITTESPKIICELPYIPDHNDNFSIWKENELSNINLSGMYKDSKNEWNCIDCSNWIREHNPDWNTVVISRASNFCPSSHMVNYKMYNNSTMLIFDGLLYDSRTVKNIYKDDVNFYHFVDKNRENEFYRWYSVSEVRDNRKLKQ